jgi:hypothetical protein
MALQQFELPPSGGNMPAPYAPTNGNLPAPYKPSAVTLQEIFDIPVQKPEKQMAAGAIQAPLQIPETTGKEEQMMLFLD